MTTFRKIRLLGTLCFAMGGCTAVEADPADSTVQIKNFMFAPTSLTVSTGTRVSWVNLDGEVHTVVGEGFRSGALDTKDSFAFKFDKPGTYHFVCSIHPQMLGTIVVQ
jgi:plastocyanin